MKLRYIILISAVVAICTSCSKSSGIDKKEQADKVVGIAWREDIAPTLYRVPQKWHGIEKEKEFNATRDINDYLLMSYCIDKDIPVMGICRGAQILGVVSGATMIQDIPSWFAAQDIRYDFIHRPEDTASDDSDYVPHDVTAVPGSRLAEFTGVSTIKNVPSWHHQCLSTVDGNCLKVTGTTFTNGFDFIEAIERTDRSLAIGLQFHPEVSIAKHVNKAPNESSYMNYIQAQSIFRNFVNKAAK